MNTQITHEEQFLAFSAIRNHHNGIIILSGKDLFTCNRICDLYAANKKVPDDLYHEFKAIVTEQKTSVKSMI